MPGSTQMVEIGHKPMVSRTAAASGHLRLQPATLQAIATGTIPKGDVIATAQVAATLAVKNTPQLIPLCHPIPLTGTSAQVELVADGVVVRVQVSAHYRTGVEMEALVGVAAALLTVWDMVKSLEKDASGNYPATVITGVRVEHKHKGSA